MLGHANLAEEAWRSAIEFDPSYPFPRLMLARVYLADGRERVAIEHLLIVAHGDQLDAVEKAQQLLGQYDDTAMVAGSDDK